MPIDTVSCGFVMMDEAHTQITHKPEDGKTESYAHFTLRKGLNGLIITHVCTVNTPTGCYCYGLFLEGARWDKTRKSLADPKPKELFSPVPVIHLLPEQHRKAPTSKSLPTYLSTEATQLIIRKLSN